MFNKKEITKEDFYNLSQLDRIEYRQRMDLIDKEDSDAGAWSFFNMILIIIGFVFLVALGMYNINKDSMYQVLDIIPLLFRVGFTIFLFLLLLGLVFSYLNSKKKRELLNEYFPLEIKRGKNVRKK